MLRIRSISIDLNIEIKEEAVSKGQPLFIADNQQCNVNIVSHTLDGQ
jgi:hypothetical protein